MRARGPVWPGGATAEIEDTTVNSGEDSIPSEKPAPEERLQHQGEQHERYQGHRHD
jgi:hypothetical protein